MKRRRIFQRCAPPAYAALAVALAWPAPVLAQSRTIPQPTEGLIPNPSAGKALYEKRCAECHGADLRGTDKGPPFLHEVYQPSHHSDLAFQLAVKNGSRAHHWRFGDMKPLEGLSADEVAHITAYVRVRQRAAGIF